MQKSTNLDGYSIKQKTFIDNLDKGIPSIILNDDKSKPGSLSQTQQPVRRDNRKPTIEGKLT